MLVANVETTDGWLHYALDPGEIHEFVAECWSDYEVLSVDIWEQADFHSVHGTLWYSGYRSGSAVIETRPDKTDWYAIDDLPHPRPKR
ncbi:MAG: hypothetical protein LC650_00775 [Actinobacteria bacterium]|nr:hypothetical protein [Actinomycetota bacterium]